MVILAIVKTLFSPKCAPARRLMKMPTRSLFSRQLVYSQFGEPIDVVKITECEVPPLSPTQVLVRMLAAPVNPADINTIQGKTVTFPWFPRVPGDEGVGEVVEIGSHVTRRNILGCRVVLTARNKGTWRIYGVYDEAEVHVIPERVPIAEGALLTRAPCTAYRLLKDFRRLGSLQTVMQNGASSAVGQCVIQMCKAWNIDTINVIAPCHDTPLIKERLMQLGATQVLTLAEAEGMTFGTSVSRPVLGLNCMCGRDEDVILNKLAKGSTMVYHGDAYYQPMTKRYLRPDVEFFKFDLNEWDASVCFPAKSELLRDVTTLVVTGNMIAPMYEPVHLRNYDFAIRHTPPNEGMTTQTYVFDFTLP